MMNSEKKKREWARENTRWNIGVERIVVCGFLLSIIASNVKSDDVLCTSAACNSTASAIRENMNSLYEPCGNFYKFACGGFLESAAITTNERLLDYKQTLRNEIRENLTITLATEITADEPTFYKLAKKLYKSCMNPISSETQKVQVLKEYLKKFGGWPVVDGAAWDDSRFDWRRTHYKFIRDTDYAEWEIEDGIGHLIGCHIDYDKICFNRIIALTKPSGWFAWWVTNNDIEFRRTFIQDFYNFVVNLAVELGADKDRASRELHEMLYFEVKLANIRKNKKNSVPQNPMSIRELKNKYPSVPWMEYVEKNVRANISITEDEIIWVKYPEYYVKLEELMSNTAKRTQANYVLSRVAIRNAVYSSDKVRQDVYNYLRLKQDISLNRNRTKWCTNQVMTNLERAISAIYVREYFDEETRNEVIKITKKINEEVSEEFSQAYWMNNKTKTAGIEKSKKLIAHIGYPDELMDNEKLGKYYENLEFDENDFFGNMDKLSVRHLANHYKVLREPVNKNDWTIRMPSTNVGAFYSPPLHVTAIHAGILRGLYFDKNRPNYLNYGGIGTIIGHEITHGYFNDGRYYDENGNFSDWWDQTADINFRGKSRCIIGQCQIYANNNNLFNIKGEQILPENVADIGGIKLAYDAYKKWAANHDPEPKLPGLEKYTAAQMFWISKANTQCTLYDIGAREWKFRWTKHAPGEYQVNEAISNLPEFTADFHCDYYAEMNRREKCKVW